MGETGYLPQNWVFNGRFSFKVWQHGQQQLCLQYKVCWILYKMIRAPSFLYINPMLQSPPNNRSSISVNFNLPIPPLLLHKIILTAPTNTPFLCSNFPPPSFCVLRFQQSTPKIFSLLLPFCQFRLHQRTRELERLVRSETVLISPLFLKVWTVITGLKISLRKFVFCRCAKPTIQSTFFITLNLLSLFPYSTNTTIRTHISLKTSW